MSNIQRQRIQLLMLLHVALITVSNFLVQFPFTIFGWHTTYGAFSYPLIFIATDLTVRLYNQQFARKVIFKSMLPGLFISYILAAWFAKGAHLSLEFLQSWDILALRVAVACFTAYVVGQLLDIVVFQRLRNSFNWWFAPAISSSVGNIIDTVIFFSIAFYRCDVPVLRDNWPEIACVDFCFKYLITIFLFVPLYGLLLYNITGGRIKISPYTAASR